VEAWVPGPISAITAFLRSWGGYFHRTLSTYVQAYRESGLATEGIIEPTVDRENLALYPELDDELRVPNFIIFIQNKPAS
jgi:hypothetical protein